MPGYVQHGPCCFSGTLDTGTPRGSLVSLGGVQTYLARPSSPSDKAVVISTDLFGLNLQVGPAHGCSRASPGLSLAPCARRTSS